MEGTGEHQFMEEAVVTQVFKKTAYGVTMTFWNMEKKYEDFYQVQTFDHFAVPVNDMDAAQEFYTTLLNSDKQYVEGKNQGYWIENKGLGVPNQKVYKSSVTKSGLPRPTYTNGYACFVVTSIKDTEEKLKKMKALNFFKSIE